MCHVASLAVMYIGLCVIQLGSEMPDGACVGLGINGCNNCINYYDLLRHFFLFYLLLSSGYCPLYLLVNIHLAERHEFRHLVDFQVCRDFVLHIIFFLGGGTAS